jgi:AcrR family transcriptional regulator
MVMCMKKPIKASTKQKQTGGDPRIGPQDWVRAGLVLLAREGIDGVRVEPLAGHLGVTKGSFYWHFKDRAALYAAMLNTWRQLATRTIIETVEAEKLDSRSRLARLIELATSNAKAARLETAMRAWAQHEPSVGKVLASVDAERLDYVASLLREAGLERAAAKTRAKILYLALIAGPELWREVTKIIA